MNSLSLSNLRSGGEGPDQIHESVAIGSEPDFEHMLIYGKRVACEIIVTVIDDFLDDGVDDEEIGVGHLEEDGVPVREF